MIQCRICKRIRDKDRFRLPWPGELGMEIEETYCPRCAAAELQRIQSGEMAKQAERRALRGAVPSIPSA